MYGFVHCALQDLVLRYFGEETWQNIITEAGVELGGGSYLIHKVYSDEETFRLVGAACEVLGLRVDDVLQKFGQHFFTYCVNSGYDRILRVLGRNLREFLCNLDALHDHLASIYPGMNAPSFRTTERADGALLLHYYSSRPGLGHIVVGIVKTVSQELLNTTVTVEIFQEKSEAHDHVIFVIRERGGRRSSMRSLSVPSVTSQNTGSSKLGTGQAHETIHLRANGATKSFMTVESFCRAFPFHIVFDRELVIRQAGVCISKFLRRWPADSRRCENLEGRLVFNDIFRLVRPKMRFSFEAVLSHINTVFIVATRDSSGVFRRLSIDTEAPQKDGLSSPTNKSDELRLKGQMIYLTGSDRLLFLCSPRVANLEDLQEKGLHLSDIPIHDATRELVLVANAHRPSREIVEKLEHTTNNLRILQTRLIADKQRTDDLLHNILPKKVAARLRLNKEVPAERHKLVTILFSDIVGFTALCSSEQVVPMDIVRLLNKLYTYFDMMTGIHEVYKVETIGDAYMVVGGLPTACDDHAERVANMACSMLEAVRDVLSPVDSKPIMIRIGLHSGPVMAGVVGKKMPRYCLFGGTVTLANKMESGSSPGKINVSVDTKRYLNSADWEFDTNPNPNPLPCFFLRRNPASGIDETSRDIATTLKRQSDAGMLRLNSPAEMGFDIIHSHSTTCDTPDLPQVKPKCPFHPSASMPVLNLDKLKLHSS